MPDIQVCVSRNDWHFQLLFFILITWATQSTSPNFNYCIRSPLSKCWGEAVEEINCCTYIFFCRHCGSCFLTVLLCHPPQVVALAKPDVRPAENKHIHANRLRQGSCSWRCSGVYWSWYGGVAHTIHLNDTTVPEARLTWLCRTLLNRGTRWCKATVVDPVPSALLAMSMESLGWASKFWLPEQSLGAADSLYKGQDCVQMAPAFEELHWEIKTELTPPMVAVGAESSFCRPVAHIPLLSAAMPDSIATILTAHCPHRLAAAPSSPRHAPPVTFPPPPLWGPLGQLHALSPPCCVPFLTAASHLSPIPKPNDKSLASASCAFLPDILCTPFFSSILRQGQTS